MTLKRTEPQKANEMSSTKIVEMAAIYAYAR